ncbi:hypothetical protein FGO68_gene4994 [Halteria grandinella]|uniref:Uncharacterized protein n=1 Tax=Halteria grandinella TaxID=5974 RepID=A0A8J8NPV6_HALGN|nr:hypothetical protein FGO68_gene4994 [Halteria grandinella]
MIPRKKKLIDSKAKKLDIQPTSESTQSFQVSPQQLSRQYINTELLLDPNTVKNINNSTVNNRTKRLLVIEESTKSGNIHLQIEQQIPISNYFEEEYIQDPNMQKDQSNTKYKASTFARDLSETINLKSKLKLLKKRKSLVKDDQQKSFLIMNVSKVQLQESPLAASSLLQQRRLSLRRPSFRPAPPQTQIDIAPVQVEMACQTDSDDEEFELYREEKFLKEPIEEEEESTCVGGITNQEWTPLSENRKSNIFREKRKTVANNGRAFGVDLQSSIQQMDTAQALNNFRENQSQKLHFPIISARGTATFI